MRWTFGRTGGPYDGARDPGLATRAAVAYVIAVAVLAVTCAPAYGSYEEVTIVDWPETVLVRPGVAAVFAAPPGTLAAGLAWMIQGECVAGRVEVAEDGSFTTELTPTEVFASGHAPGLECRSLDTCIPPDPPCDVLIADDPWEVDAPRGILILIRFVGSTYHPLTPERIFDTRWFGPGGRVVAGTPKPFSYIQGRSVPGDAAAVVMNVTVTNPDQPSYLSLLPFDTTPVTSSALNFRAGQTIANLVTVAPQQTSGAWKYNNRMWLANAVGSTDVVIDVVGYYQGSDEAGLRFTATDPNRVLDSRTATGGWEGPVGSGNTNIKSLLLAGGPAVPNEASAVTMNVTVTNGSENSFLQVFPSDQDRPNTSNINFAAGETTSNLVTMPVGEDGAVNFFNAKGHVDVVVDVVGYYAPGVGGYYHRFLSPQRVLDDRVGLGLDGPWHGSETRTFDVPNLPDDVTGLVANLTATNGTKGTFLAAFPGDGTNPGTSSINVGPNETKANHIISAVPPTGSLSIYNELGTIDVVLDAYGYFAEV